MTDTAQLLRAHLRARFGLRDERAPARDLRLERAHRRSGLPSLEALALEVARRPDHDPMVQELLSELTIGETYLFRDRGQLDVIEAVVLPAIARELPADEPVRVWSAGCATGEEPLTLAALLDRAPALAGRRCEVVGTDLVEARLDLGRAALAGDARGLRPAPDEPAAPLPPRRAAVALRRHNLLAPPPPELRELALVVCRNVLIYFGEDDRRRVLASLAGRLSDAGWLVLGHAEGIDAPEALGLVRIQTGGVVCYRRRPAPAAAPTPPTPPLPPVTIHEPSPRPLDDEELVALARARADAGDGPGAEALARQALRLAPASVPARLLLAAALEERGDAEGARRVLLEGSYLAPESPALRAVLEARAARS